MFLYSLIMVKGLNSLIYNQLEHFPFVLGERMLGRKNECFSEFFLVIIMGILFLWLIPESHPHLEMGQSQATTICHHFSPAFHVFLTSAVNSLESFVCWSDWLLGSLFLSILFFSLSLSLFLSFSRFLSSISLPRVLLTYFSLAHTHTHTHTHIHKLTHFPDNHTHTHTHIRSLSVCHGRFISIWHM